MDCTGQDALQWQAKGAPVAQMMPLDAAQERYYYFGVPKNAQHPAAAKLFTLFMLTDEGQKLSYDTWKIDLHTMPGSQMGKMVGEFSKMNVRFKARFKRRLARSASKLSEWKSGARRISLPPLRQLRVTRTHCMSLAIHSLAPTMYVSAHWRSRRDCQR
jgi:ABC-type Fe3+ transport system substrate-binding protein